MPWHAMAYAMASAIMVFGMPPQIRGDEGGGRRMKDAMAHAMACHGICHGIRHRICHGMWQCGMALRLAITSGMGG